MYTNTCALLRQLLLAADNFPFTYLITNTHTYIHKHMLTYMHTPAALPGQTQNPIACSR
jgi:hypothetical protein